MAEHHRACASCGTANEEDARFCEGCGGAIGRACGTCGVEASATARFCRACGATLDDRVIAEPGVPAAGPSRKTVTVMFADLAGSTTFEEQVDAETARDVIGAYHDLLRSTAERNRAGVMKYIGDGFMAVWGVPEIRTRRRPPRRRRRGRAAGPLRRPRRTRRAKRTVSSSPCGSR